MRNLIFILLLCSFLCSSCATPSSTYRNLVNQAKTYQTMDANEIPDEELISYYYALNDEIENARMRYVGNQGHEGFWKGWNHGVYGSEVKNLQNIRGQVRDELLRRDVSLQ